jgi:AcrR family transcriptional regulator
MNDDDDDEVQGSARERPMRADALKNRQRILDAAAAVFADQGVSVPIDVVAERAGVGVGTLYRHVPTKEALFEAIVTSKIDDLVAAARAAADAADPGPAFFDFVKLLASEAAVKADIFDVLDSAGIDIKSRMNDQAKALEEALDHLLTRAVCCGAVRGDVVGEDVLGLVVGTCHGARRVGRTNEATMRLIAILCEGLRGPSARTS